MLRQVIVAVAACGLAGASTHAELVNVTITGVVDFNVIGGNQAGIPSGAPVQLSFNLDSNVFADSMNFPTRGYEVILDSFSMTVGGQPIEIVNPQSGGVPVYFVLRDNDPAVDGFFLSAGNVDWPFAVGVNIPGIAQQHELNFSVTYSSSTVLSSLDILDAVGTYDLTGISSYGWTAGVFGTSGAEYAYQSMVISVVPGPGALAIMALGGAFASVRRRRRCCV